MYFSGIIGEGVAAVQIEPNTWSGSIQYLYRQKGYWVILTDIPNDNNGNESFIDFYWNNEIISPIINRNNKY